jgi:hypothetical protein
MLFRVWPQGHTQDLVQGVVSSCAQSAREKFSDHAHFWAPPSN